MEGGEGGVRRTAGTWSEGEGGGSGALPGTRRGGGVVCAWGREWGPAGCL